jgi:hypothetical protein
MNEGVALFNVWNSYEITGSYIEISFIKKKIENGPISKYLFVNQSEDRPS